MYAIDRESIVKEILMGEGDGGQQHDHWPGLDGHARRG